MQLISASFSEPKPLDKETVSTQSVSHLDPEGVVFASFVFYYRSERQLKKMGLIKEPPKPSRSITANNTPVKQAPKNHFGAFSSDKELIPKGAGLGKSEFGDFRDGGMSVADQRKARRRITGLDDDYDDERLNGDELGRDPKDLHRELNKTEEDVRLEKELAEKIDRIKLKRSHSNSSLKKESSGPTTPPTDQAQASISQTTQGSKQLEPETPAKKRRGSNDADVKSPALAPATSSMQPHPGMSNFGGPPERGFGGYLNSTTAMDEEEL